jgi:hypothetical protein
VSRARRPGAPGAPGARGAQGAHGSPGAQGAHGVHGIGARVAWVAAAIGVAAALAAGYAAAGPTGLIDAATLATLGALIVARGTIRGEKPPPVRAKRSRSRRPPALRAADFPAYASIASDVEWAQMSRRHYEHAMRPMLTRLAASLGRPQAVADLGSGPGSARSLDPDGPGVDLATLERIVTTLEGEP